MARTSGANAGTEYSFISYRGDIDGLRAVAVLSVVAYHLRPDRVGGGFVGVDVFFVISGFLISSIIYGQLEARKFGLIDFYLRRVRRIFPALILVLACACVAGLVLLSATRMRVLGAEVASGSAFIANFYLWRHTGYFAFDAGLNPLLHLWSLSVEEQFYLVFPLLCALFYRARSSWSLPAAFLIIGVASMALNLSLIREFPYMAFYFPFTRLWELLIGAGLSLWHRRAAPAASETNSFPDIYRSLVGALGLAMIVGSVLGLTNQLPYPGWWALLPTVGTALCIAAGPSSWINRHILSSRPAIFFGLISYPLYLWHWVLLSLYRNVHVISGLWIPSLDALYLVGLSVLLAYLTYRFVEQPIRTRGLGAARRGVGLQLLAMMFIVGTAGVVIFAAKGFPGRFPPPIAALDHEYSGAATVAYRQGTCFLQPEQGPSAFTSDCIPSLGPAHGRWMLLWGDSHAADLYPGLKVVAAQAGWQVGQYTASACEPIVGLPMPERPNCQETNDWVIRRIAQLHPDLVVLSALWAVHRSVSATEEALTRTITQLAAAGVKHVIVVGSAPVWKKEVPLFMIDQIRRQNLAGTVLELPRDHVPTIDDTWLQIIAKRTGAGFVPIFDLICGPASCQVATGPGWQGVTTYDRSHFTVNGSHFVARRMWPRFVKADPQLAGPDDPSAHP